MISITTCTMWKCDLFLNFLKDLVKIPVVDEIIITNNNINETPKDEILNHPKIKMFNPPENLFPGPSYNHEFSRIKNEICCMMSDDVVFDIKVLYYINEFLKPGKAVLCVPPLPESKEPITGNIEIIKFTDEMNNQKDLFHFGSLIFMCKSDWVNIPAGLNFFYGDIWILDTMLLRKKEIYLMKNFFYYSPFSNTINTFSNKEFLYQKESLLYSGLLENFKRQIGL